MMPHPTRRRFLRSSVAAAAVAPLLARWAMAAEDAKASEAFTFLVLNDLHYFDRRCTPWFARAVEQMKGHKADFCLVVGDLTEDGARQQNGPIRELLDALKMPVHVVVGNHDYEAGNNSRKAFEAAFAGPLNYAFEHKGYQFVGLDTTQGRAASNTTIADATLTWTADALKKLDRKRPTVLFTHFPLGPFVPYRPKNADVLLRLFGEHALQTVFNGHFHSATNRYWDKVLVTTNTCCSFRRANHDFDPRKGYFLCTAKGGAVERAYVEVKKG
jgi:3',5'-cyclic AMP phosphodiesterase CpdA